LQTETFVLEEKVSFEKYISNKNLPRFADKTLELIQKQELQGGHGVDIFATGHYAVRKVNNLSLWENEEWVKDVFGKLKDFDGKENK